MVGRSVIMGCRGKGGVGMYIPCGGDVLHGELKPPPAASVNSE